MFWLLCKCFELYNTIWAPSSEFVSSSIPSWQISTVHAQTFRGARDLAFCLKVRLDSLFVWASSKGSGETARMRRLAWTFAARIGYKYQIRLTRSICDFLIEPAHDKTNKITSAPSEDSDQPGHPPCLIWILAVHSVGSYEPKLFSCRQRRLRPVWSRSSLGAHAILLVLSCDGSVHICKACWTAANWCKMVSEKS